MWISDRVALAVDDAGVAPPIASFDFDSRIPQIASNFEHSVSI